MLPIKSLLSYNSVRTDLLYILDLFCEVIELADRQKKKMILSEEKKMIYFTHSCIYCGEFSGRQLHGFNINLILCDIELLKINVDDVTMCLVTDQKVISSINFIRCKILINVYSEPLKYVKIVHLTEIHFFRNSGWY